MNLNQSYPNWLASMAGAQASSPAVVALEARSRPNTEILTILPKRGLAED